MRLVRARVVVEVTAALNLAVGVLLVIGLLAVVVMAIVWPLIWIEALYRRRQERKRRARRPGFLPVVKSDVDDYAGFDRGAP